MSFPWSRNLRAFWIRLRGLFGATGEAGLQAEIESHLQMHIDDNLRAGMNREEARRRALIKFGGLEQTKQSYRERSTIPSLEALLQDIRYALRRLRKSPAFTLSAIVTLALAIGANVVVFGVLNAVVLHPLHIADPQNVYQILHQEKPGYGPSYPDYLDYRDRNTTFSGIAASYGLSSAGLSARNSVRKVFGYDVTGNYFDVLGIHPERGVFFHSSDERGPNSAPFVVLSDALWKSQFNADPAIIGATVDLDNHPFTVIGVAPREFHGHEQFLWPDYWIPIVNEQQIEGWDFLHDRLVNPVAVIGRLKPGVTAQQAAENLTAIANQLGQEYPAWDKGLGARLIRPGLQGDDGEIVRAFLFSVMALALLVLAAACVNLASLFAARAADRSRELALRIALGSSHWHVIRQLLTEAVLASFAGGVAGTAFALGLMGLLNRWQPFGDGAVRILAAPDLRVFLAAVALSLVSGLAFGLIPARQILRTSAIQAMKSGTADFAPLRRFALRDLLLGVQIALCTLLVTASLVAVRSMMRALHAPLGIEPRNVTLAGMDLSMAGVNGDAALQAERRMAEAAARIPGVSAAGIVNYTPLSGSGPSGVPIYRPGTVEFSSATTILGTKVYYISPGYLRAAGTHLLTGRNFTWHDDLKSPRVAIVNQAFAAKMFGGAAAIGQHFRMWGNLYEVVGVAEDGIYNDLAENPQPAIFVSFSQVASSSATLVVRSERAPSEIISALQPVLADIEPNLPITFRSWTDALSNVFFPARAAAFALGIMGALGAMLAVTGIFGMATYSVSKRMKELGIRAALGARRTQLMQSALGRPLCLLLAGSVLGLALAAAATRLLAQIVYEANPRDPLVLGGVVATMTLLGVLATWIPGSRALKVDPARLMRGE